MMVCPSDVRRFIWDCTNGKSCRNASVIATQRPSVGVITGVIKANIPSRISFLLYLAKSDSRTILDCSWCRKIIRKGDMLFYQLEKQNLLEFRCHLFLKKEVEGVVSYKSQGLKVTIRKK